MAVPSGTPSPHQEARDATRRTWLANERTWLAWVRTGLTATAVALALGKVVPDLARAHTRWPYVAIGVGYDSTSAFVAAFRRTVGVTPGRYFPAPLS